MKIRRKSFVIGFWLGVFWAWTKPVRQVAHSAARDATVDIIRKFTERLLYGEEGAPKKRVITYADAARSPRPPVKDPSTN